jgi:hypothetical protein
MGNDNHVSHKLCGRQTCAVRCVVVLKEPVTVFYKDPLANSITDPNGVCKLMDCSATVFMNEFSNFVNIFCPFAGAWLP